RLLDESDRETTALVAVVNEKLARTQWPGENPLGKRFRLLDAPPPQATTPYLTVAGRGSDPRNRPAKCPARPEREHPSPPPSPPAKATTPYLTVAGVVSDARNRALNAEPRQEVYIPLPQQAAAVGGLGVARSLNLAIRASAEPTSLVGMVRQEVRAIDGNIFMRQVRTMEQIMEAAV